MSRRVRDLSLCLAALAAGAVLALAVGSAAPVGAQAPSTASIEAYDLGWRDPATGQSSTAVAPGGTVTFSYPSGLSFHNVAFSGLQPSTCSQTAGNDTGAVPPLPANPDGAGWSGTCRFDSPGTYAFFCDAHPSMTGAVRVGDTSGTTTTPPPGTTTAPPGSTGDTPADPTPGDPPPAPRVSFPRRQRGSVVRGTVTTPAGRSRIVVTAFATSRALSGRRTAPARRVRVGSQSKRSAGTGRTALAVTTNAAARRALQRRGRLPVSVRVAITPPAGPAVTRTVAVVLSARRSP